MLTGLGVQVAAAAHVHQQGRHVQTQRLAGVSARSPQVVRAVSPEGHPQAQERDPRSLLRHLTL